jgi:hypothetical protein
MGVEEWQTARLEMRASCEPRADQDPAQRVACSSPRRGLAIGLQLLDPFFQLASQCRVLITGKWDEKQETEGIGDGCPEQEKKEDRL